MSKVKEYLALEKHEFYTSKEFPKVVAKYLTSLCLGKVKPRKNHKIEVVVEGRN